MTFWGIFLILGCFDIHMRGKLQTHTSGSCFFYVRLSRSYLLMKLFLEASGKARTFTTWHADTKTIKFQESIKCKWPAIPSLKIYLWWWERAVSHNSHHRVEADGSSLLDYGWYIHNISHSLQVNVFYPCTCWRQQKIPEYCYVHKP